MSIFKNDNPNGPQLNDDSVQPILESLAKIMAGDFEVRLPVNDPANVIDAINSAINTLAEEMAVREKEISQLLEKEQERNTNLRIVNQQLVEGKPALHTLDGDNHNKTDTSGHAAQSQYDKTEELLAGKASELRQVKEEVNDLLLFRGLKPKYITESKS